MQSSAAFFPAAVAAAALAQRRERLPEQQRSAQPAVPALRTIFEEAQALGLGGALGWLGQYAHLRVISITEMRLQRKLWLATEEDLVFFECDSSENACAICLDKMRCGEAVVTSCHHCFHTNCARESER